MAQGEALFFPGIFIKLLSSCEWKSTFLLNSKYEDRGRQQQQRQYPSESFDQPYRQPRDAETGQGPRPTYPGRHSWTRAEGTEGIWELVLLPASAPLAPRDLKCEAGPPPLLELKGSFKTVGFMTHAKWITSFTPEARWG